MKSTAKFTVLALFAFGFLQGLEAQQGKQPLDKERLAEFLAKREERQQIREAYEQAKQVRDLIIKLSNLVLDGDEEVRYHAARGLAEIGPSAAQATHNLASRLFDESPRVRVAVAEALSSIGPAAKEAVPDLVICLKDSDPLDAYFFFPDVWDGHSQHH
jgi:hypothetical protein